MFKDKITRLTAVIVPAAAARRAGDCRWLTVVEQRLDAVQGLGRSSMPKRVSHGELSAPAVTLPDTTTRSVVDHLINSSSGTAWKLCGSTSWYWVFLEKMKTDSWRRTQDPVGYLKSKVWKSSDLTIHRTFQILAPWFDFRTISQWDFALRENLFFKDLKN